MRAEPVRQEKIIDELGNTIELKMWRLQEPTPDKPHGFKYSLVYVVDDVRVIGYDNAEGQGDHRHIGTRVSPYRFTSLRKVVRDFYNDIDKYKRGEL